MEEAKNDLLKLNKEIETIWRSLWRWWPSRKIKKIRKRIRRTWFLDEKRLARYNEWN